MVIQKIVHFLVLTLKRQLPMSVILNLHGLILKNILSRLSVVEVELEEIHLKFSPLSSNEVDVRILKQELGEHTKMCNYPANIHDKVKHAYLKDKPYQIRLSNYPFSREKHPHHFQASWFTQFSSWLEYY